MWRALALTALVSAVAAVGVTALLINIVERKQEARNPFFRVVELTDETEDPAVWGKNFPSAVRQLPAHGRSGADALRRQRGRAARADRGRSALGRRPVAARGGSAAEDDVGRLCVREGLPRGARARLHARGPGVHGAAAGHQAAGHLHPLPRLGLRAVPEGRRRRPHQGLRGDEPDALRGGADAREVPGVVHRLPRSGDDAAARHAARLHRGDPRRQGVAGHRRTTT